MHFSYFVFAARRWGYLVLHAPGYDGRRFGLFRRFCALVILVRWLLSVFIFA